MTPTAVLRSLAQGGPATYKARRQAGAGVATLQALANLSTDWGIRLRAQGILWAESTCRVSGTFAVTLRKATPWQVANLLLALAGGGCEVIADVSRWINANEAEALKILGAG